MKFFRVLMPPLKGRRPRLFPLSREDERDLAELQRRREARRQAAVFPPSHPPKEPRS